MNEAYNIWSEDPTPENLNNVVKKLNPVIQSEAFRHGGGPVLHAKAKQLAIGAIKSYDPTSGARLSSWAVTQMQPLSRYKSNLRPVRIPEVAGARAAELHTKSLEFAADHGYDPTDEELADYTGMNLKKLQSLRGRRKAVVSESAIQSGDFGGDDSYGGDPAIDTASNALELSARAVYDELDERSKRIYDHSLGTNGRKLLQKNEIAKRLGVTPAYISIKTNEIAKRIADSERLFRS